MTRCKICLSEHHRADSCPDSTRPLFAQQEPDIPRQAMSQEICRRFNENRCFLRTCKYWHACSLCRGQHTALSCSQQRGAPMHPYGNRGYIRRPVNQVDGVYSVMSCTCNVINSYVWQLTQLHLNRCDSDCDIAR